jgi:hypothetical protein
MCGRRVDGWLEAMLISDMWKSSGNSMGCRRPLGGIGTTQNGAQKTWSTLSSGGRTIQSFAGVQMKDPAVGIENITKSTVNGNRRHIGAENTAKPQNDPPRNPSGDLPSRRSGNNCLPSIIHDRERHGPARGNRQ